MMKLKLQLQFFGGRGSAGGKKGYLEREREREPYRHIVGGHEITIHRSRGNMTVQSFGEGWENGYHVEHTDYVGGKFIDEGTVGDYTIGDKVLWKYSEEGLQKNAKPEEVEITFAHIYPNGKVEYTVKDSSGDGHSASAAWLDKYNKKK